MKSLISSFLSVALILSSISCGKNKEAAAYGNYTMNVDVAHPITDSVLLHKTYPGYLASEVKVDLVARVSGFLQSINFKAGDKVSKGQLLFVIEPTTYKDAVEQAESQLATARSQYEYARSNYRSMKEAAKSEAVSQIDVIQSESNLNQSIAAIKNAEAALSIARTNLSYCYIKAPFSGHITKSNYDVGNYLNGSAAPQTLATLYDDRNLYAYFAIEDRQYINMVNQGKDKVESIDYNNIPIIFNDSLPHNYTGELNYLSPVVDKSTGTLTIRAKINNKYGELKSGMYVNIRMPYEEMSEAILIDDASIGTDQLGKYVYLVNDSNKVVYTPIKTGDLYKDTLRIVTQGLTPKDRYVTKALLKVRDGMKVNPVLSK